MVTVLDRESLALRAAYVIGPATTIVPKYTLDVERRRLYIGDMTAVELAIYAVP